VPSRGPEPSISTRPALPRRDERPAPPIPPRLSSSSDNSSPPPHGRPRPPVPLNSRPTVLSNTPPPRSPIAPEHRPSQLGHHNTPYPPPPPPQLPTPYPLLDSTSPSSPTFQLPMPNYLQMPQPGNPWYPPPNPQPAWSPPGWTAPTHFPTPGQPMVPFGYPSVTQGGYGDSFAFPGGSPLGQSEYGYAMPQAPAILEHQQLNPGPPPPLHSRKSCLHAPSLLTNNLFLPCPL